jgi:fatty-acyl-CoA synthase
LAGWNFAVLVDAIAREHPRRPAVVRGARRLTWGELGVRARAFAWHLSAELGIAAGDRVAIVLPNCAEYLEAFVATRKVLGAPLNIGAISSVDDLHRAIDASDAKVIVASATTAPIATQAARRIPKRWRPAIVETGDGYEGALAAADPPAEWTVELPTADDLVFLATHDVAGVAVPGPTVMPVAPLAERGCFTTALGALGRTGCVVFSDSPRFDPGLVWRVVADEGVETLLIAGDPYARPLLSALLAGADDGRLASLQTISSSGRPLSVDVAEALRAALPRVTVVDRADAPAGAAPTPPTKAAVLASSVEDQLRTHRSIVDCVVLGVSDPRVGKIVVALVEIRPDHYLDEPELTAWCRAHLPSTMTPARFVVVDEIGRTESGSVDRDALRALAVDRLTGSS